MRNFFYLALVLTALISLAEVKWEISPYSTNVTEKGRVRLQFSASWPGSEPCAVRTPKFPAPKGVQILDVTSYNETTPSENGAAHRAVYLFDLLVTNAPGTLAETGEIEVNTRPYGAENYVSSTIPGISFKVTTKKGPWLLGCSALLLLAALAIFLLGKKVIAAKNKKNITSGPSLEERYQEKLSETRALRLSGETAAYFLACEEILRSYLREKYGVAKIEDWREEKDLYSGVERSLINTAKELTSISYNVRYAGYEPSSAEEKRIYDFINELLTRNRPLKTTDAENLYLKQE